MKRHIAVSELARDERFERVRMEDQFADPRLARTGGPGNGRQRGRFDPASANAPDPARGLMHGIFTGEIQALEGAGRTRFDFDTGTGTDAVPFELKLDMARQCWDEARHCEISAKLGDWMGTEIGEFAEGTILFEAACNADPVLRLAGVNRALEGLAIDVFNTMREFGETTGDPILEFCEDWMLADEVTHVKMGSDWLRRITADNAERRKNALEFQRIVDRLFSGGGFRGEDKDDPIQLARQFRAMAGFDTDEINAIADDSRSAKEEVRQRRAEAAAAFAKQAVS